MLDLAKYHSIGAARRAALAQFANEVCLIESDRERERERLTYREFRERGHALAKGLQDSNFSGERPAASGQTPAAIIMTNQPKWLISAYAIFHCGGVLVPLDYKLTADEHWQLLKHSGASVLITEYPIWRQLAVSAGRAAATNVQAVLVTEAPANAVLAGAQRSGEFPGAGEPVLVPGRRRGTARIVYSSATGGRPKSWMMKHAK